MAAWSLKVLMVGMAPNGYTVMKLSPVTLMLNVGTCGKVSRRAWVSHHATAIMLQPKRYSHGVAVTLMPNDQSWSAIMLQPACYSHGVTVTLMPNATASMLQPW